MQIEQLHSKFDKLQHSFGHQSLRSIYGAGCIEKPKVMLVFMNPTGKNISSQVHWKGLRAPWLGTKTVWQLFHDLWFISDKSFKKTQELKTEEWTADFAEALYLELKKKKVYITNLAKCTQIDARSLKDSIFREYLDLMFREIELVNPDNIITFGNQVSSIILNTQISVSKYFGEKKEILKIGKKDFNIYPVFYPVGQGRRNMPLAVNRICEIIK